MSLDVLTTIVEEGTTPILTMTLQDQASAPIPLVALTTLTLTSYDVRTGTIINSRNAQSVLNANNGTYHATSGLFTWELQPADTIRVSATAPIEEHAALLQWSWNSGTKVGADVTRYFVRDVGPV